MDYIDKIILSNDVKQDAIKIFIEIDTKLRLAYDLLDKISGIEDITRARDIIYNIRHDIKE